MRSKLILLLIIAIFVAQCFCFDFTQDDAFISYRYVENFIQGNGLVFNSGERVEGYTNFLWIIILSIFAKLGLDMITVSKILGVISGCVSIFLLYRLSSLFFSEKDWLFALFPPLLLTSSSAFAYWSISGLETAFFVMMVLVSVYLYLTYQRLWVISGALSTLIRPEGALIFGIIFLHRLFFRRDPFKQSIFNLVSFVLLLLPWVIFKMVYYGDILPNPFYAKTGLSWEYLKSGLEYFWLFLRHYGLWGALYLFPIFFYKSLDIRDKLLTLMVYLYTLYVIVIGGDVLMVHRFFLPILPLLYLLLAIFVRKLNDKLKNHLLARTIPVFLMFSVSITFFLIPLRSIRGTRTSEKNLVGMMQFAAEYLKKYHDNSFSIAITTIGSIAYYAGTEVKVIDMLGLTDKYISRHPEKTERIAVTWKERNYNSQYVLSLDPDFILFSTGYKPSAPAEKALLLNSKFRRNYYVIPLLKDRTHFVPVFKKKGAYLEENKIFTDARFTMLLYESVHLAMRGKYQEAIDKLKEVISIGPEDLALPYVLIGEYYAELNQYPVAQKFFRQAIQIDDYSVVAHVYLALLYDREGRHEEAEAEKRKVFLYDPNFQW